MSDKLSELSAEVEALVPYDELTWMLALATKDALRYRWLRDTWDVGLGINLYEDDGWDKAIDSAMERSAALAKERA